VPRKRHRSVEHAWPGDGRRDNRLLARLPDEDFQQLLPHLKIIPLPAKKVLQQQGERLQSVYFPIGGVVSMAIVLPDGAMVETATIGDEGIVGIEAFFTDDAVSPCETIVQIPGAASVLSVDRFRSELAAGGAFRDAVARYAQALYGQMTRLTACNALHQVQERCARRLLMAHDHMHEQPFYSSHESLAVMLGVRRPTVTVVAGTLQTAGLIRYTHGRITVLDRKGLEAASCECYQAIRSLSVR
jgi:CRP-like cAMP-binding protein